MGVPAGRGATRLRVEREIDLRQIHDDAIGIGHDEGLGLERPGKIEGKPRGVGGSLDMSARDRHDRLGQLALRGGANPYQAVGRGDAG